MSFTATTSKWRQNGKFLVRCYSCDFRMATKTSPQAVVKRHVEQTGHRVEVSRAMWKIVEPGEASS